MHRPVVLSPRFNESEDAMKREDLTWAATCGLLAFSAAVFGAGRGFALAWPWFIVGGLAGLLVSWGLRNWRGEP